MSTVQVADQTFVAASPQSVADAIGDRQRWRQWFRGLDLLVGEDRGDKGIRWSVSGALVGTMEVWLEPSLDGVIVHYFLHAEPSSGSADALALNRERRVAGKRMSFEIKRRLEAGRAAGEPPTLN